MVGYSGTPLIKKLGIKPDSKIIFINEPASFYKVLGELPTGLKTIKAPDEEFDYIHYFIPLRSSFAGQASEKEELGEFFKVVKKILKKDGALWISWPKKSSKLKTDLDENKIREIGLSSGLVDVKVAAIDETWSGLKFVYRLKDR